MEPNEYGKFAMPDDDVMQRFIKHYIEGFEAILPGYSKKPENSIPKIMYETKLFTMVCFLFWTSFFMFQRENVIKAIPLDIKANYVSHLSPHKNTLSLKSRKCTLQCFCYF